ncbi:hypothetical protein CHLRE_12g540927v5 [Chlamydomonas reinhardtii]|uniref:DNA helicase n=1 Tax=Chlamydomonas reinhardtii TaxID=3055 RepID=A0A2K3D702_CHLRE|nr:uncharacterized protein CHLRE_12g540927v5 [Chlamydomonas reinhardtii]PNW76313.1 hypothetical protein CHLRE_12g540927v5 [Chlamydomonas reinhardtii]
MGRNKILAGVCPGVAGLLPVKLSALLVLVGGVARREEGCSNIRGELHLLMLGDPGTGKSQIMKWACRASPGRAVLTTGRGSSGAGLTVAATRDGNSWALEAGALVLADGGLCCIDEFDGIRPQERAVIHEAMEQQTVHVAKAGLVTNLSTRTAIIGAINPRPGTTVTCGRALTEVTGLEGPLLSRFDLVLLLADPRHPDWDRVVAGHVLARGGASARSTEGSNDPELFGSSAAAATSAAAAGSPAGYLALPAPGDLKAPLPPVTLVAAPAIDEVLCSMNQRSQPGTCSASSFREPSIAERIAARLSSSTTGVNLGDCHPSQAPTQPAPKTQTANCNMTPAASAAASGNSASSAWTVDVIRAYIAWVRSRPPPVMTHEAERVLVAYYSALRRAEERSTARSTIRALESLIRISQAHARVMCSDQVLLRDSVVAVVLADSSQQLLAIPGADSITNARFPDDPDGELFMQQQVVLMRLQLASLLPAALPGVTASG